MDPTYAVGIIFAKKHILARAPNAVGRFKTKMAFTMAIFEIIGEVVGQILVDIVPFKIVEWAEGKRAGPIDGYSTDKKRYIKFNTAKKFLLTWENDVEHLTSKIVDGLATTSEKLDVTAFQFRIIDERTIVQPVTPISFFAFHFLVQWLSKNNIKTIGIVETALTTYVTYNDPDSKNLIGQTDKGKKFFISLMDDYSRAPFLRISSDIKTIEGYDVLSVKDSLANSNGHKTSTA